MVLIDLPGHAWAAVWEHLSGVDRKAHQDVATRIFNSCPFVMGKSHTLTANVEDERILKEALVSVGWADSPRDSGFPDWGFSDDVTRGCLHGQHTCARCGWNDYEGPRRLASPVALDEKEEAMAHGGR